SPPMIMWVLRGFYGVLVVGVAVFVANYFLRHNDLWGGIGALILVLAVGGLIIATDVLIRAKEITTISAVYFGLLLGLLLGSLFADAMQTYLSDWLGDRRDLI